MENAIGLWNLHAEADGLLSWDQLPDQAKAFWVMYLEKVYYAERQTAQSISDGVKRSMAGLN